MSGKQLHCTIELGRKLKQGLESRYIAFLSNMRYYLAWGMGHGAWGMGHWALGMGHWAYLTTLENRYNTGFCRGGFT